MISVKTFEFSPFSENTYLLYDETNECVIIDAGNYSKKEDEELSAFISEKSLKLVKILNTHGHIDHIFGLSYLKKTYNVDIYGHREDDAVLDDTKKYGMQFGIDVSVPPKVNCYIEDNDVINFGNSKLSVIHLPGHTPGGVGYYNEIQKILFSGDVLFNDSIGRTDFPGGNYDVLMHSIKAKLLVLPQDVVVYSGHGPATTIGKEARTNPFL